MAGDERDVLKLLESELRFIELGGYNRSSRGGWYPKSIFRDSLTCINFGFPDGTHSCNGCHLLEFVCLEHRSEEVPCHFIDLSSAGETIAGLRAATSDARLKHVVKHWLRWKISQLRLEGDQMLASPQTEGG